jgi:hypothetical protein
MPNVSYAARFDSAVGFVSGSIAYSPLSGYACGELSGRRGAVRIVKAAVSWLAPVPQHFRSPGWVLPAVWRLE